MVFERRLEAGGGLASEEPTINGFWHNTGSYFLDSLGLTGFDQDLELDRWGAAYIEPQIQSVLLRSNGAPVTVFSDLKRTVSGLRTISGSDAERWEQLASINYGAFRVLPA